MFSLAEAAAPRDTWWQDFGARRRLTCLAVGVVHNREPKTGH
jgi:hypothetical protein